MRSDANSPMARDHARRLVKQLEIQGHRIRDPMAEIGRMAEMDRAGREAYYQDLLAQKQGG